MANADSLKFVSDSFCEIRGVIWRKANCGPCGACGSQQWPWNIFFRFCLSLNTLDPMQDDLSCELSISTTSNGKFKTIASQHKDARIESVPRWAFFAFGAFSQTACFCLPVPAYACLLPSSPLLPSLACHLPAS